MRSGVVNAFTSDPFGGNPAAVVLLPAGAAPGDAWMQAVAAQYNLSETAFLSAHEGGAWGLRWFTPTVEVALCGHATLASAHWLWEQGVVPPSQPISFSTASGILTANRRGGRIGLDCPLRPVVATDPPSSWREALPGIEAEWVGSTADRPVTEQNSLVLTSESELRRLEPDLRVMRASPVVGWIVTAPADGGNVDFVSRYFAPAAGVDEDPVTGSAHCALAYYWSNRLQRRALRALQLSARQGEMELALHGVDRVELLGAAVTVADVELLV